MGKSLKIWIIIAAIGAAALLAAIVFVLHGKRSGAGEEPTPTPAVSLDKEFQIAFSIASADGQPFTAELMIPLELKGRAYSGAEVEHAEVVRIQPEGKAEVTLAIREAGAYELLFPTYIVQTNDGQFWDTKGQTVQFTVTEEALQEAAKKAPDAPAVALELDTKETKASPLAKEAYSESLINDCYAKLESMGVDAALLTSCKERSMTQIPVDERKEVQNAIQGVWTTVGNSGMASVLVSGELFSYYEHPIINDEWDESIYVLRNIAMIRDVETFEENGIKGYQIRLDNDLSYRLGWQVGDPEIAVDTAMECYLEDGTYSGSDSLVKDARSIAEFQAMIVAPEDLPTPTPTPTPVQAETQAAISFDSDFCSFQYPAEWAGLATVSTHSSEDGKWVEFCQKNAGHDEEFGFDYEGWLYSVVVTDIPPDPSDPYNPAPGYFENPGLEEVLGEADGLYAYLVGPTDVQFDYNDPAITAEYESLASADVSIIKRSFRFK